MSAWRRIFASTTLLALVAAGCGDASTSSGATGSGEVDPTEFCEGWTAIEDFSGAEAETAAEAAEQLGQVIEGLDGLAGVPDEATDEVEALRESSATMERLASEVADADDPAPALAERSDELDAASDEINRLMSVNDLTLFAFEHCEEVEDPRFVLPCINERFENVGQGILGPDGEVRDDPALPELDPDEADAVADEELAAAEGASEWIRREAETASGGEPALEYMLLDADGLPLRYLKVADFGDGAAVISESDCDDKPDTERSIDGDPGTDAMTDREVTRSEYEAAEASYIACLDAVDPDAVDNQGYDWMGIRIMVVVSYGPELESSFGDTEACYEQELRQVDMQWQLSNGDFKDELERLVTQCLLDQLDDQEVAAIQERVADSVEELGPGGEDTLTYFAARAVAPAEMKEGCQTDAVEEAGG